MAVTCHSYSLRSRSSTSKSTAGPNDPARVLFATGTTDRSSVSATVKGMGQRSPERKFAIEKKIVGNKTTSTLSSEGEGRSVNTKRPTNSLKVKVSKCSSGAEDFHRELDIEEAPPPSPALYKFAEQEAASIRSSLLNWYDEHHRVLPWRQNIYSRRHEQYLNTKSPNSEVHEEDEIPRYTTGESDDSSCVVEVENLENGKMAGTMRITSKSGRVIMSKLRKDGVRRSSVMEEQRAYEVWVSEMMLQQTRVAYVMEYYKRWMERWPTLHHLARASQEEVNSVWAGLGYYRRARFLLEGAKLIAENGSGFPRSLMELLQVPGIGEYTAGAIASIAFQQPVPVVDGNVIRVLSRLRAISANPKLSRTVKIHWALAKELVDATRPGDLNQSIMELGATVCTSTSPSCYSCPISSHCKALTLQSRSLNVVTDFPVKVAKVPPRDEYVATCVLVVVNKTNLEDHVGASVSNTDSHILLVQRPKQGLLAGLWEFPSVSLGGVAAPAKEQRAVMDRYLKDSLGFNITERGNFVVQEREAVGTHVHVFSHIKMHMSIEWVLLCPSEGTQWQLKLVETKQASVSMKWVTADTVDEHGLTSSVKKVYSMYQNHLKLRRHCKSQKSKRFKSVL